jgi:hypothetical protein
LIAPRRSTFPNQPPRSDPKKEQEIMSDHSKEIIAGLVLDSAAAAFASGLIVLFVLAAIE